MDFIKNIIADHKDELIDSIFDDELKDKVVKAINDNVDVPFISESTEEKVITALYDSVEEVIKGVIAEKL